MLRFLTLSCLLALSACDAANDKSANREQSGSDTALAAPRPDGVDVVILEHEEGPVAVKTGQRIAVELVGVPTAGYEWAAEMTPPFLKAAGTYGGPTSTNQLEEGFTGGHHWEAFLFDVTASGEGELRFEQRRPWEDASEPAMKTFSVSVTAED